MDYRYLPKKDLQKYAYNNNADAKAKAGKILKQIVPNKGNPQAYQKRITDAFIAVTKTFYLEVFIFNRNLG